MSWRRVASSKMKPDKETLLSKYFHIAVVVAAYWIVSISLVFVNKHLLTGDSTNSTTHLDAPLFVTWFQCVITVILCMMLGLASCAVPKWFTFTSVRITAKLMWQVAPLSVIFVAMVSFNNLCLKYVDVSFYYIGRSLTTVFNVVLTYTILRQSTSTKAVMCCAIIIGGFFLGVDQEKVAGSLSIMGVTYGILASLFVALYSIFIKKVLPVVNGDVAALTYCNNINACLLFLPLMYLTGEVPNIFGFAGYDSAVFWWPMIISGVFGFGISYLINLQVKVTSPLTNNISGTAKACAQTVMASGIYHESKPVLWWVSNMVVLLGSALYTRVKQVEMSKDHAEKEASAEEKVPLGDHSVNSDSEKGVV